MRKTELNRCQAFEVVCAPHTACSNAACALLVFDSVHWSSWAAPAAAAASVIHSSNVAASAALDGS